MTDTPNHFCCQHETYAESENYSMVLNQIAIPSWQDVLKRSMCFSLSQTFIFLAVYCSHELCNYQAIYDGPTVRKLLALEWSTMHFVTRFYEQKLNASTLKLCASLYFVKHCVICKNMLNTYTSFKNMLKIWKLCCLFL